MALNVILCLKILNTDLVDNCNHSWVSRASTTQRSKHFKKHFDLSFSFHISGIHQADEAEMKLLASAPHSNHVFSVANFDMIPTLQRDLITQICSAVDNQLNVIISGDEGEEMI